MSQKEAQRERVAGLQSKRWLMEEVTAQAIYDALQSDTPQVRREAIDWLWVCCPDIAEDLGLPK